MQDHQRLKIFNSLIADRLAGMQCQIAAGKFFFLNRRVFGIETGLLTLFLIWLLAYKFSESTIELKKISTNIGGKKEERIKIQPNLSALILGFDSRKSGLEMVHIQGGTFIMDRSSDEKYKNECREAVTLHSFSIGKYEVTQADWREIMGNDPELLLKGCDQCPVVFVSWNDVQDFIKKLNATLEGEQNKYRLPTEQEWEFSAHGGSHSNGYKYAGSNDIDSVAWHYGNSNLEIHLVGEKKANELGLYDMSGNVWEWCQDIWKESPCDSNIISHDFRVLRGGGFYDDSNYLHISFRDFSTDSHRYFYYGFRLAQN